MRVFIRTFFVLVLSCLSSCSKDDCFVNTYEFKSIDLSQNELYEFDTKKDTSYGGGVSDRGSHYKISELLLDSSGTGTLIFKYQAKEDYVGLDTVEITLWSNWETSRDSDTPTYEIITYYFSIGESENDDLNVQD